MEKGIKILEEFINNDFQKDKLERNEKGGFKIGTIYKTTELNPALENLIKGYRELEKRIIQLTNLLCINDSDENHIPKSKIKEIRDKAEVMDYYTLPDVIDDLNKLLED